MSERPLLRALAARAGILDGYRSALDDAWVATSDRTREALLAAMGIDASGEAAARAALDALDAEDAAADVEPVRVAIAGRPDARRLAFRAGSALEGARVDVSVEPEAGVAFALGGALDASGAFELPDLEIGRYVLRVRLVAAGASVEALQHRFVVPERCVTVDELLDGRPGFGVWANLYSIRSGRNLGFGNLSDLASLVRLAGREGAAFVGLNPLHALAPGSVCPYQPLSRLFRHPHYLDPERVPELAHCPEARRALGDDGFQQRLARLRAAAQLDASAVSSALDALLEPLHRCFTRGACGPERARAFARFREEQGPALTDFATFAALADDFAAHGSGRDWRHWPAGFRSAHGAAVRAFRDAHPAQVERHMWIQFELDRQLGEVAGEAERAGLALGLYSDVALGSDPGGSDAWAFPDLLAQGARVGAPPDDFSREGQEWGFPPPDPTAQRRNGHDFWVRVLRAGFRHAGALRLDHAMGMQRLFWIPEGSPPADGAYVRYPHDELLGIVALESRRQRAAVIGEDLGTLPEGFADALAERGILSSRVLLFEREGGAFLPAEVYPSRCLVTANTHDLPPLAALAGHEDLDLRRRAGHIPDDAALEHARADRVSERAALCERLRADGWLDAEAPDESQLAAAVTAFLCATPSALVGLSLDDLAAEHEPLNLPGVPGERHPSWTRRMSLTLDELWRTATARAVLAAVAPQRRRGAAERS